jgi:hypothetical protein
MPETEKKVTVAAKMQAQFGIIVWPEGQDPIVATTEMLEDAEAPDALQTATVHLHVDLVVARGIAVSLFGPDWRDFVMDVYDRLLVEREAVEDDAEPEPARATAETP